MTKEEHPAMDYKTHNEMYATFIKLSIYGGIFCTVLTIWAVIAITT